MPISSTEAVFTEIYFANAWGDAESVSGPGSSFDRTRRLRAQLSSLIRDLGVRSLLDAGCGDFNWMKSVELAEVLYVGVDLVAPLIGHHAEFYAGPQRLFLKLDLLSDPLPKVDLILCRDCLVHFSFDDNRRALRNMKQSGSALLLATTFTAHERNEDIATGAWRPLNFERAPFQFPPPVRVIEDGPRPDGTYPDKTLGLYRLQEIGLEEIPA